MKVANCSTTHNQQHHRLFIMDVHEHYEPSRASSVHSLHFGDAVSFLQKSTCMFEGLFFVVSEKKIPSTVLKCHMMLKIGPSSGGKKPGTTSLLTIEKEILVGVLIHFPTPLNGKKVC